MKIYLAAAWPRRAEIAKVADDLRTIPGVEITSRWLAEPEKNYHSSLEFRRQRAIMDVEDVEAADILVRFTDDMSSPTVPVRLITGARMFEMGMAYSLGKEIIVVGGVQPIFDYLPGIVHLQNPEQLKCFLRGNSVCVKFPEEFTEHA